MGLFRKKIIQTNPLPPGAVLDRGAGIDEALSAFEPVSAPNTRTASDQAPYQEEAAAQNGGRKNCRHHLEALFKGNKKGVALKLYIENFKRLNDVFGYEYCEELLSQILQYLSESSSCPVYRYVGVEFIMILKNYSQSDAIDLADEIIGQFDKGWKVHDTDCLCSVQIGMCSFPGAASNEDELLKCLDLAVAKASDIGPNQSVMYDSSLHTQFLRRQSIARYIKTALNQDEIEIRYRPTYNISTKRFTRAEFYMRIFIQGLGFVGSAEFIPIAEDSGQIRTVEYYALDKVASLIARLIQEGRNFDSIAIPISPVLLLQEDFLSQIRRVIDTYQIPAGKLGIEISENAMNTAYVNITILMQELSDLGVEVILNDFGSGSSGISQIFNMPIQTLKFERMFIWQLETTPQAAPIIEGLIQIAKKLNYNIIAEGVETENQLKYLHDFDCKLQQGFYYSPTLPEDVLVQILDTSLEQSQFILAQEKEKMRR